MRRVEEVRELVEHLADNIIDKRFKWTEQDLENLRKSGFLRSKVRFLQFVRHLDDCARNHVGSHCSCWLHTADSRPV